MRPSRFTSIALAFACCALLAAQAWAGIPTDQVRVSVDRVLAILQDPALKPEDRAAERRAAVREAVSRVFDFAETARRALGPHWQRLGEQDRAEFVALFTNLLERAYLSSIEQYSGETITYVGESVDPAGDLATVKTTLTTKKGVDVPVEYSLLRRGDRWLVYDVFVEGISLVRNYRSQFNRIIQTASYEELIRRMKAGEGSAPGGGASPPRGRTPRS